MTSQFRSILDEAVSAVDVVMAETVEIRPWSAGNAMSGAGPDTSRPVMIVVGVLRGQGAEIERGTHKSAEWGGDMQADAMTLSIARPVASGLELRDGDRVAAMDREGSPVFEVNRIDRHILERLRVHLTPLGRGTT